MLAIKRNGQRVWVTFTVTPNESLNSIVISGEWNDWKEEPMKKKANGDYYITKILKADNCFQFGYKVNSDEWLTEEDCSTILSPYSSQNSLLEI